MKSLSLVQIFLERINSDSIFVRIKFSTSLIAIDNIPLMTIFRDVNMRHTHNVTNKLYHSISVNYLQSLLFILHSLLF